MHFEYVKKRIIKGLVEEIESLGATELELIGHYLVQVLEGTRMVHHGLNKDYKPAGYTVDTFSHDSMIVGEYSTEKNYFEDVSKKGGSPSFEKIENDIAHAVNHRKPNGPEKIYLVSNQEEPPSFRGKFNSTRIAELHGKKTVILDAREIAKLIFEDSVGYAGSVAFYRDFLPDFAQNLDNYEYYGKVPVVCENHCFDESSLNVINKHVESGKQVCVLYGLSGSGKTQVAIDYIHHSAKNFENYIWISGSDWMENISLSAIQRSRGGVAVNVMGMFNASKTLLVIDDINRVLGLQVFQDLAPGFSRGGVVLATSQVSSPGSAHYLEVPTIPESIALHILGETPGRTSEIGMRFMRACRFSPLILATARKIAEAFDITKDDLYRDILEQPGDIAQEDGTSVMKRILGRLDGKYLEGLVKIANSGSSMHDSSFLNHFLGANIRINLQRLSILKSANAPGVLVAHDLICRSVRSKKDSKEISSAIEGYISKWDGEMVPSVLREIHLCANQLVDFYKERGDHKSDWITYALLQVDGVRSKIQKELHLQAISAASAMAEVVCIIDAKEAYAYSMEDQVQRQAYYQQCANEYRAIVDSGVAPRIQAELLHHQGKALRRCGLLNEAVACFNAALKIYPTWHVTYGQIAHLGIQCKKEDPLRQEGEKALNFLVESMLSDSSKVPLRVSLATIARLRSYSNCVNTLSANKESIQKLADIIAMSALESLDQFYEAYLSFTSIFGYHHGALCVRLAESFPEMLAMSPSEIDKRHWVSACEALTNTSIAAARDQKNELSVRISAAACIFAEEIDVTVDLSSYDARAVAKAYIASGKFLKALERIDKVGQKDHWILYQKSKAELAIGSVNDALNTAKMAFDLAQKDSKGIGRLSSYHDQLSRCYEKLQNYVSASDEAKQAISKCKDPQYSKDLLERLEILNVELARRM